MAEEKSVEVKRLEQELLLTKRLETIISNFNQIVAADEPTLDKLVKIGNDLGYTGNSDLIPSSKLFPTEGINVDGKSHYYKLCIQSGTNYFIPTRKATLLFRCIHPLTGVKEVEMSIDDFLKFVSTYHSPNI